MITLPNSTEIEEYVLGCLMIDQQDFVYELSENDFYKNENKLIYKSIKHLKDKDRTIDFIEVSELLQKRKELLESDLSMNKLSEYVNIVPTTSNIEDRIEKLKLYTAQREILMRSRTRLEELISGSYQNAIDFKNDVNQLFDIDIKTKDDESNSISSILVDTIASIEDDYNKPNEQKYYTGIEDFDKITAGLHSEELTIIAARPGHGKTALAAQILINIAKSGNKCLFISREMSKKQLAKRMISNIGSINGNKLRMCKTLVNDDWTRIAKANEYLTNLDIEIDDKKSTIEEVRSYCRKLKMKGKLDLLVIDYLQLMKTKKKTESRRHEIEDISRQCKEMTLEFGMPIILLSQLSREGAKGEPDLHHLRETGAIEQDADNVHMLYMEEDQELVSPANVKLLTRKQRNGPTGYTWLRWFKEIFRFCGGK